MSITARALLDGKDAPVCVTAKDLVSEALELMLDNAYSQLPVVDDKNRPIGLITTDSILGELLDLEGTLKLKKVNDVFVNCEIYSYGDDLSKILAGLKTQSAVIIIDIDGAIKGIITDWDTSEYFREKSQNIILVEEIEKAVIAHIEVAFSNTELFQNSQLQKEIENVVNSQAEITIRKSVAGYVNKQNEKLNKTILDQVIDELRDREKSISDLSFRQYSQLLLTRWDVYGTSFGISKKELNHRLIEIGKIRNKVAHFQEISSQERKQLIRAARWFENNKAIIHRPESKRTSPTVTQKSLLNSHDINPIEYLAHFLENDPGRLTDEYWVKYQWEYLVKIISVESNLRVNLTVDDLRRNLESFKNLKYLHNAGWTVTSITSIDVTFDSLVSTDNQYIEFFLLLLIKLRKVADFDYSDNPITGGSYHKLGAFVKLGGSIASLALMFTRDERFLIELYIDSGNREKNKELFDLLYLETDSKYREQLTWERLENKRASRVAVSMDHWSIDSPAPKLDTLQNDVISAVQGFYNQLLPIMEKHHYRYRPW